jgi:TolB protein
VLRNRKTLVALLILSPAVYCQTITSGTTATPHYAVAFASFAPLNTDIFVAEADGSNPRPLLAHPGQEYNPSFSRDGKWVVFTSERNASADVYRVHPDGSGLEKLTHDQAFDDQGTLSPDGKSLAFVSSRSGQAEIWLLDLATKKSRNITNNPAGDFRPSWSPDGQWLAFSSDRDSKKPKFNFVTLHSAEIYLVRPDGSGLRRVTQAQGFAGSPTWSADGKGLVFYEAEMKDVQTITSPRRQRGTTQIVTVDLLTNERRVLTSDAGEKWSPRWLAQGRTAYVSGGPEGGIEFTDGRSGARGEFNSPSWSADGRRMVFHRDVDHNWPPLREWHSRDPQFLLMRTGVFPSYSPTGQRLLCNDKTAGIVHNSILIMDADGSQRSILFTDSVKSSLGPVWSPRGDKIAFALGQFFQASLGPAIADIAVMRADGTGLKVLTDGSGNYGFPSWSPDGLQIVYRSASRGKNGLFIINVEKGEVKALPTGHGSDNFPSWSPAGGLIAFTSNRDGDSEIYTVRPDGTDVRRLTYTPGNEAHCTWSPDGKWIAFASAGQGFKDEAVLHPYNPQPYGEIYVMRADGSDVRMLTDNQYEEGTPSWMPTRSKRSKGKRKDSHPRRNRVTRSSSVSDYESK